MKILYIIRGVPGAGKSTFAHTIWERQVICEADKYFIDKETGEYKFDGSKIKDAHQWCRDEVESKMKHNQMNDRFYPEIVVSNTFTTDGELEPYIKLAEQYGYTVFSLIIENRHGNSSVHSVPLSTIQKMKNRFSIKL